MFKSIYANLQTKMKTYCTLWIVYSVSGDEFFFVVFLSAARQPVAASGKKIAGGALCTECATVLIWRSCSGSHWVEGVSFMV